jgi:Fungal Zn(2)-Cys(6) binuclear cluster domain
MIDAPLRRRRRPALSCLECRRRKIKCDQKNPCGQCAPKSLTCIFSPSATAAPANHQWRIGTSPPTPSSTNHASLDRTGNTLGDRSPRNFSNQFLMPASSPETFSISEAPQLRRRPSLTRPAPGGPDTARTIEFLVHRVQKLEQILSESSSKAPANLGSSSITESTPQQMRGILSKTRLFGQSHWMTSFEQVREANYFT